MRITAAVTREDKGFSIEEVELDEPRADEVLVRLVATGMCRTDLISRDGGMPPPGPAVLGHEGAGVVEAVGERVTRVAPGDHIVLGPFVCGACPLCAAGRPAYCENILACLFGGARPDGSPTLRQNGEPIAGHYFGQSSFATHSLIHERAAIKVSADLPLDVLGPLACGIQTGAGAVLNSLRPPAGTSIAVFGTGSVGLSAVMAARLTGCPTIVAVDGNPARLALAAEFGATHTVNRHTDDPLAAIQDITGGRGVDYALEAAGIPEYIRTAFGCTNGTGTVGILGVPTSEVEVSVPYFPLLMGKTLRGIVWGDSLFDVFIPALAELHRLGRLPIDRMVTFYDLADINTAAADSAAGRIVKPVLRMP